MTCMVKCRWETVPLAIRSFVMLIMKILFFFWEPANPVDVTDLHLQVP